MNYKTNPWTIVLSIVITTIIVGSGIYYWQKSTEAAPNLEENSTKPTEEKFRSLLYERGNYNLPFGAAEVEGYYTTVERPTELGDDPVPTVNCSAFVTGQSNCRKRLDPLITSMKTL